MNNNKEQDIQSNVENLELYSDNYPFRLSLRISTFESEAGFKKFIKNCENMLRKSSEYRLWRAYIVDVLQINHCMITHESMDQVTIDVHHHIPSLSVLLSALVNKKLEEAQEFCTFDICEEAIVLHFQNKIGYTTLISSMHEKFHNGHLDIPIEVVKGDYRYFVANYSRYIEEDELDVINSRLARTVHNCSWARDNYPVAASMGA